VETHDDLSEELYEVVLIPALSEKVADGPLLTKFCLNVEHTVVLDPGTVVAYDVGIRDAHGQRVHLPQLVLLVSLSSNALAALLYRVQHPVQLTPHLVHCPEGTRSQFAHLLKLV